ncbi:MAG: 5'/3'-nucleotidase SurE [Sphaerochaeta sp.]|jgi:5'-nucleotidase|nr:5'/3'-nucleotidase SurE [Sphaerochaeta sp.]MDX9914471.1 5'/3'-nucleotidase SurE [Sphaerochaeta sp.]
MRILLTNDDGYTSEGLSALTDALVADGHEVWVCAPSIERSASSHAMTLHQEITITEFGPQRFHCSGTPVDCILYATKAKVFDHHPDLVISGINHGFNISTDILYSGTVAAAREAALTGLKAIAVSCSRDTEGNFPFARAAAFIVAHLEQFSGLASPECVININIPGEGSGTWKSGVPAYLDYHDVVERRQKSDDDRSMVLGMRGGITPSQRCDTRQSDFQLVEAGYVSVTALAILPPVHGAIQQRLEAMSHE